MTRRVYYKLRENRTLISMTLLGISCDFSAKYIDENEENDLITLDLIHYEYGI